MLLAELPHFINARRYVARLTILGVTFAALGLALTRELSAHAAAYWRPDLPMPRALGFLGAASLIAAAGLLSVAIMAFVRHRLIDAPAPRADPAEDVAVPAGE